MKQLIGFRFEDGVIGDIKQTMELLSKIGTCLITEERQPYKHFHGLIYTDKSVIQFKRWVQNKRYRGKTSVRGRKTYNNMWIDLVDNDKDYIEYILKNPYSIENSTDIDYWMYLGNYYLKGSNLDWGNYEQYIHDIQENPCA